MRKIFIITLAAMATLALSVACSKVNPVDETPAVKVMTIQATLSDAATRVTFDPAFGSDFKPTGMAHTWEAGDQLRITDAADASKTAVFDLVDGAGTATGKFQGEGFEAASYNVEAVPAGTFGSGTSQTQAKDGATDHLQFVAAATGVTDLSAFTLTETSNILAIIAKLPAGVAGTIDKVSVDVSMFGLTMTAVSVVLTAQEDADADDVLKIYANVPAGFSIPSSGDAFLKFSSTNSAHSVYTRYLPLSVLSNPTAGKFNYVKLNCSHIDQWAGGEDDGMEENPYLIADKYQMQAMHNLIAENETKCFKLIADVDLENEEWVPLNTASGFAKGLCFDGNGHTVKNLKSSSANDYPSFTGVLNGTVKDLTFDGATIDAGNNTAGVLAGYIGSGTAIFGSISGITVKNSSVSGSKQRLGGIAGYVKNVSGIIDDCHVLNTTVESSADRVGGLFGQFDGQFQALNCTADNVSVHGSLNIGGLIGVLYGSVTNSTSSGSISSSTDNNKTDIGLGGLVGYIDSGGTVSKCSSSVVINHTTGGRALGGLVGYLKSGKVEKSFATGSVTGQYRNTGGLVGLITVGPAIVENSYCTGSVSANAYTGGLVGYYEKGSATITNCYAAGNVEGAGFAVGGLIGYVANNALSMSNCAAWNGRVTAANIGDGNWSSGAVVGVTFPNCTLTDNYRNPSMALTAWWVPDADYSQPNVSTATPLVVKDKTDGTLRQTTATGLANTQDNYPQFAYHGKVEGGKTLSQLASSTLGWSSAIWDFSGELPVLK